MQDQDIKDQVLQQIQELMMQLMGEKLRGGGAELEVSVEASDEPELPQDASPLPEEGEMLEDGENPLDPSSDEDDDLRRLEEMYRGIK